MLVKDLIDILSSANPNREVLIKVGDSDFDYPFVRPSSVEEEELMFNGDNIKRKSWGFIEPHAVKAKAIVIELE